MFRLHDVVVWRVRWFSIAPVRTLWSPMLVIGQATLRLCSAMRSTAENGTFSVRSPVLLLLCLCQRPVDTDYGVWEYFCCCCALSFVSPRHAHPTNDISFLSSFSAFPSSCLCFGRLHHCHRWKHHHKHSHDWKCHFDDDGNICKRILFRQFVRATETMYMGRWNGMADCRMHRFIEECGIAWT